MRAEMMGGRTGLHHKPRESSMASKAGREINTWRTPEKLYMKCLVAALWDEGLRGNSEDICSH